MKKLVMKNRDILSEFDEFQCQECGEYMIGIKLIEQQEKWEAAKPTYHYPYNPQNLMDFLHRECPMCGKIARIIPLQNTKKESGKMDAEEAKAWEADDASPYFKLNADEPVNLKVTKIRRIPSKFDENKKNLKFVVLEIDGEKPLKDPTTWEVSSLKMKGMFLSELKKRGVAPENYEKEVFSVRVAKTGEGMKTRYEMDFLEDVAKEDAADAAEEAVKE